MQEIIFGGPGTGKTTELLGIVDAELERGVPLERIAYVSFTRKAADEALARRGETRKSAPYWRTIHALAYAETGVERGDVMQREDYGKVAAALGLTYRGGAATEEGPAGGTGEADRMLGVIGYARATLQPLKDAWHETGGSLDWWALDQFARTLDQYKADTGKIDFDDMLWQYVRRSAAAPVDVAIIDEAQDLSKAQWAVVRHAFKRAKRTYIAGDDDQAIYKWSGADVGTFLALEGERRVLPRSHRLPREVHDFAQRIVRRIKHRQPKDIAPGDHPGRVEWIASPDECALGDGSWLVLARNRTLLAQFVAHCRMNGIPYMTQAGPGVNDSHLRAITAWERLRAGKAAKGADVNAALAAAKIPGLRCAEDDGLFSAAALGLTAMEIWHEALTRIPLEARAFYLACLRRGRKLSQPRVTISTIHGVKGGEADNVLLCTDLTGRSIEGARMSPDDEARVWYVGATRARRNLFLLRPQTRDHYVM